MPMNLRIRTIGLSRQSVLVTPTGLNRLTSFTTLYESELHSSGGVTKSSRPYNNQFSQVSYPLNPMSHE
jgi:hypothetical protein